MKYRIVKKTYGDDTNLFIVQQKRFLFWGTVKSRILSYVDIWDLFPTYDYIVFSRYESAEEALNEYIKEIQANTLVKTEVVSTFKSK
jgi:hypothetical protein